MCSSYSQTFAKSSVEAGEARLKGLRPDLAAVKHKKQIEEVAQIKALARLHVLKEKYASLQKAKCAARSNERNTVTSELDPSDEGTAAGEQGFLNSTKRVEAAKVSAQTIMEEHESLKENVSLWESLKEKLLCDRSEKISATLDDLIFICR